MIRKAVSIGVLIWCAVALADSRTSSVESSPKQVLCGTSATKIFDINGNRASVLVKHVGAAPAAGSPICLCTDNTCTWAAGAGCLGPGFTILAAPTAYTDGSGGFYSEANYGGALWCIVQTGTTASNVNAWSK